MQILVTGKNGQLGSEIQEIVSNSDSKHTFIFVDSKEGDLTDNAKLRLLFEKNSINAVINCAAYTAVDKAESDSERAYAVNATGVQNLVDLCSEFQARLLHISTDYVFDGNGTSPYLPSDSTAPSGVYGASKRAGEEIILNADIEGLVVRTSWVYSFYGNNFVKTMLRLGKEKASIGVVSDQIGCPTYAKDLALACLEIIEAPQWNREERLFHFSNSGTISWFEFAKKIMELAELNCQVNPITTADYPTPAKRPSYSAMNTDSLVKTFGIQIHPWENSLKDCLMRLEK